MATQADTDVYLEELEEATYTGKEPSKVRYRTTLGLYVGKCEQRVLVNSQLPNNEMGCIQCQPSQGRIPMSNGLLCPNAPKMRNRRMPNGTYGGVRGRKAKVGGKLTTFVFLLLYLHFRFMEIVLAFPFNL
jgi:hypothetical protein